VETFISVHFAIGFLIGLGLYGWAAVSTVRREGFRVAVRSGARTYIEELPLYWRVPVVAWMFVKRVAAMEAQLAAGRADLVALALLGRDTHSWRPIQHASLFTIVADESASAGGHAGMAR
jgi:hypothetical protein